MPNSSSSAITSSTVSSESAPRSATKAFSLVAWASSTPSCSAMIFLTRASISLIWFPLRVVGNRLILAGRIVAFAARPWVKALAFAGLHVHATVHVQFLPRDIGSLRRRQVGDRVGDIGGFAEMPEGDLGQQRLLLRLGQ